MKFSFGFKKNWTGLVLSGILLFSGNGLLAQWTPASPGIQNTQGNPILVHANNGAPSSGAIYIGHGNEAVVNGQNTGPYNVAIGNGGPLPLGLNQTRFNTAIGNGVLSAHKGYFNSFYGYNTGVGYGTLLLLDSGTSNTAVGASAMTNVKNGNNNTAFGSGAMAGASGALQTGSSNSAFGNGALGNIQSGASNVGIGVSALSAVTTGSYNIGIGSGAVVPSATASNQLSIQNVIYGINMTNAASGNVGIGVVPSGTLAKLEVGGTLKVNTVPATANPANTKYLWVDAAGIVSQSTAGLWGLAGNSSTVPGTGASQSFIGTTDAQRLVIATGAVERMTVLTTGAVGIGTAAPAARLDVTGTGGSTVDFQTTGRARIKGTAAGVWFNDFTIDKSFLGIIGSGTPTQALGVYTNGGLWNSFNVMDNGSVSIGAQVTNTNAKLDVTGNIFANNKVLIGMSGLSAVDYTNKITPYALAVNGDAIFNKVKVKLFVNWADYVFEENYGLLPLADLEKYIQQNKHLPEVASASEIDKEAIDLGANQVMLLKKIEELTLYIIEQNKQLQVQGKQIIDQNTQLQIQGKQIEGLTKSITEAKK